jgi:hypothetical protein
MAPHLCHQKEIVLISSWVNKKTFHMIKITKTFEKNKMCTSYLNHPTEHPLVGPNMDPLGNPNQCMRSHQSSTSKAATSRKMNHCT